MLVEMAVKERIREVRVPVEKKKKVSYLPKLEILVGLLVIGLAAVSYFNWYELPKDIYTGALFLVGVLLILVAFRAAYWKRRKEIAKKYL